MKSLELCGRELPDGRLSVTVFEHPLILPLPGANWVLQGNDGRIVALHGASPQTWPDTKTWLRDLHFARMLDELAPNARPH